MVIYHFRIDGHEWSDYRLPDGAKLIREIDVSTVEKLNKAFQTETGRIRALAERLLKEQQVGLEVLPKNTTFWGRIKWLFAGK